MKIKKVELRNINSLAGDWNIDFESADFADSSMYCISGPTGSGKTSILDAICLALYGLTPRQEKINSSVNEVMTYGTLECFAKVTFECKGSVYSACWSQHRAEKSRKLQSYSWVLTDEETGENKASFSNQKDIEEKMKNLIGLDFDQFTKSMMLAQGEFNKFLKCNENDRAAILEKLTGDEIYRKIAIAVHDLYAKVDHDVEQLKVKMDDNQPMSDEDRKKLDDEIATSESQKKTLTDTVARLTNICNWYETLHERERSVSEASALQVQAIQAKQEFEPNEAKLVAALAAQELESAYGILGEKRKAVQENDKSLKDAVADLPKFEDALKESSKAKNDKAAALDAAKKAYAEGEILWEKVSTLDVKITGAKDNLKSAQDDCSKKQGELEKIQQGVETVAVKIQTISDCLEVADGYIQQNGKDAEIESKLSLLETKNRELKAQNDELKCAKSAMTNAKKALEDFDASLMGKKDLAASANDYLENHKDDANLVNVLPQAKSFASEATRHQIESERLKSDIGEKNKSIADYMESHKNERAVLQDLKNQKEKLIQQDLPVVVLELREHLKDGCECPVCGSKEHPACDGHAHPVVEGIESLNGLAENLRTLNGEIDKTSSKLTVLDGKISAAQNDLVDLNRKLEMEKKGVEENLKNLNDALSSWENGISLKNARGVLKELESLSVKFIEQKNLADTLGKELSNAEVVRAEKVHAEADAKKLLEESQNKIQELSLWFREQLSPWFSNIESESIDALLLELKAKSSDWCQNVEDKQNYGTELASLNTQKAELEKSLADAMARLASVKINLKGHQDNLSALGLSRKELFGEKVVETERQAARNLQKNAEDAFAQAADHEQKSRETVNSCQKKISELQEMLGQQKPELDKLQAGFMESLAAKNFADEQAFVAARLPESERKALAEMRDSLEHKLTEAKTSVKNANEQFAAHQAKRDFKETEEVAKIGLDEFKTKLDEFSSVFANLIAARKNDDDLRRKCESLLMQLNQLTEKRDRWAQMQRWFNGNKLNNSTGNEFVRFIQVITLKNLLRTANGHLHDMFPRYELTVKDDSLDIMLIDHHNSDAIRPISNISGGEGFLVSLALALGISTLASKNVCIDSMFLDEGFGTLDARMLQDTIVVLQKLQQEKGKMLGVITHVDLVKGELPIHIDVVPQGGGRSLLKGAGVSRPNSRNLAG
ncbi:exonuclease SbcC [Fibrobacter sp. UWH9]|uniref:AAA family ATPase n=1 Tax=Fibrobacter sp. UWH9 TaxID=1896213 RepID=UPI00091D777C|nr:AAA family ATPase [Fibrobacter sp. UWH9]SHH90908.1 exonuclease SbcC [Fibrobacter sp. UWH9]